MQLESREAAGLTVSCDLSDLPGCPHWALPPSHMSSSAHPLGVPSPLLEGETEAVVGNGNKGLTNSFEGEAGGWVSPG